ncbi:MAG: ABC transporter substrate-binding protein [Leptospiraceae bacterium]|nr:ABC transporter substrate-binding protein [Leptospiraceae bacterium]MBL0262676.1 ABC transporter substrate-binding protein [Leptospiraceae bacterium]MBP9162607.1 ABC transporter substrate-binding protein [Leptospiraceae bacterium]
MIHKDTRLKPRFILITNLFLLSLLIHPFFSCKKTEKVEEIQAIKVDDVPWTGDVASIPEALKQSNPIASPNAVKGGSFKIYSHQFPKSLNYYLEQYSTTARIYTSMFEPLTANHPITLDNIPHIAKEWKISKDKKKFTFIIDQNAKWSDDKPITAHDVLFTFNTIMDKKNNTAVFRIGLSRFEMPVVIDDYTIEFTAKNIHWDNFNTIATGIYILPKHYYEGKDFNKENFEFPIISGPYKLAESKPGRYVRMVRRGDYWQRAYPFNNGRYNFDDVFYKVYNEEAIGYQAMLKGDMDIFPSYKAATWVTEAVGEKFDKNYIVKQRIFNEKPLGFQGWAMNTRRDIFKDKRVRKAIAHLVNRKEMIEKLAYNEYDPTNSYYPDYYLNGEVNPNEAIEFDPEKARELLTEAGWKPNASGILEKGGKEFSITILDRDKSTEKYFTVFMEAAKQLGIKANIETTDLAAWSARKDNYDFDLTWAAWGGGVFKDPEPMWFAKYADEKGQNNLAGIKNKEVDALIEKQKSEFSLAKRNEIVKKIDTIIYKEYPYVLLWHLTNTRLMYWNKFGMPDMPLGRYGTEDYATDFWWFDSKKNEELEKAIKDNVALPVSPKEVKLPKIEPPQILEEETEPAVEKPAPKKAEKKAPAKKEKSTKISKKEKDKKK